MARKSLTGATWLREADIGPTMDERPLLALVSMGWRNTLSWKEKMEWIAMGQKQDRGFGAAGRTELWDRWQLLACVIS